MRTDTVFVEASKPPKALIAFEKALEWQELFDLAARDDMDEEELAAMGVRVAGRLFHANDEMISKHVS